MKKKKIGIITTLDHNIGDDFVREGIICLLRQLIPSGFDVININKHQPLSVYPSNHPLGLIGGLTKGMGRGKRRIESISEGIFYKIQGSKFDHVDLIIQSGAPCLFNGCASAEWSKPIWEHLIGRLHDKIPVLNLAAGTAYSWKGRPTDASELDEKDKQFLKMTSDFCKLVTVRDGLAKEICDQIGVKSQLLPCTAFLSGGDALINSSDEAPILVNYMEIGGHYQYGQAISPAIWRDVLGKVLNRLSKRHEVVFICHTEEEYRSAKIYFSQYKSFLPKNVGEYYKLIANSKAGIFNRMHACVALAGIGGGSIGIGNDTRLLMLEEIGIKNGFISEVTVDELEFGVEEIIGNRRNYKEKFTEKKKSTKDLYLNQIKKFL